MNASEPEFDRYARNYGAGFDDPLKARLGADARAFLRPKLDLLRRAAGTAALDYLDFGCGTGDFLALIGEAGLPWRCQGCDISGGMLTEARQRWPEMIRRTTLWQIEPEAFPENRYDLITAICVFHHIPPDQWSAAFARLHRALRPGGQLCLFEHNPWNPVTAWMVSRTAIDADANLLSSAKSRRLMREAGYTRLHLENFLFFPPRWRAAGGIERALGWLPLGGQYLLRGFRPAESGCATAPSPVT